MSGWKLEYSGHLMVSTTESSGITQLSTESVCVDAHPLSQPRSHSSTHKVSLLKVLNAFCSPHSLSCGDNNNNNAIPCVVCSKEN